MLRSDFRREAQTNFQNYFVCTQCVFFQHIDVKSTSVFIFQVKLKSILNQISIRVFLKTFSTITMQQT